MSAARGFTTTGLVGVCSLGCWEAMLISKGLAKMALSLPGVTLKCCCGVVHGVPSEAQGDQLSYHTGPDEGPSMLRSVYKESSGRRIPISMDIARYLRRVLARVQYGVAEKPERGLEPAS